MKTEKNFKEEDVLKSTQFCIATFKKFQEKSASLKNAAQAFETGDFLNIFLNFWGF